MKLWVGLTPENIPSGYTYVENFEEVLSFIERSKRICRIIGDYGDDLWNITEISVPFEEVEKYTSLFAVTSENGKPFVLTTRN